MTGVLAKCHTAQVMLHATMHFVNGVHSYFMEQVRAGVRLPLRGCLASSPCDARWCT